VNLRHVLLLIGLAGSGKNYVRKMLKSRYIDFDYIGFGDELRQLRKSAHPAARQIAHYQDQGLMVPDHVVFNFFSQIMGKKEEDLIVLDGFPRNLSQLNFILELQEVSASRIHTIHINRSPDRCWDFIRKANDRGDRNDDEKEIFLGRVEVYNEQTLPMVSELLNRDIGLYQTGDVEDLGPCIEDIIRHFNLNRFRRRLDSPSGNCASGVLSDVFSGPAHDFNPGG
jgi:adenylate kinase family enzyme